VYYTVDCKKIEYIKSQKQMIYIIVLKIGKLVLLIFMMYSIFVQSTVRMSASKETILIYSTSEEVGKAFVHANCNSSERKRPYSRVLYLVLFDTWDTSLESQSVTLYSKF
jgi:hypothetical protein